MVTHYVINYIPFLKFRTITYSYYFISDGWKENRQFLAKCYASLKDYKTAIEWLDKANELPVNNPDVS